MTITETLHSLLIIGISGVILANWSDCKDVWERFNTWAMNHIPLFSLCCIGSVVLVSWGLS